jgi:hypothetical protein
MIWPQKGRTTNLFTPSSFFLDTRSGIRDPGWKIHYPPVRDKHPGTETLLEDRPFAVREMGPAIKLDV